MAAFEIEGRPARFEVIWDFQDSESRVQRLTVDLQGLSPGTLKIFPEGFFTPIAKFFGAQDLKIGDKAFDGLYVVKATPADLAARLFGGPRRVRLIDTIRAVGRYMSPTIDLSRERLRIQISAFDADRGARERILAAGRELTAAILALKGTAVIWMEPGLPSNARCPVCGTRFSSAITTCRECRTPHHHECWLYAGGCSTYACGQRAAALRK